MRRVSDESLDLPAMVDLWESPKRFSVCSRDAFFPRYTVFRIGLLILILFAFAPIASAQIGGDLIWAKSAGGSTDDAGQSVATLADGSLLVTGFFDGSATFGSTTLVSDGGTDIFIAKYNPDGSLAWAQRAGGTDGDAADGIVTLPSGGFIIAGRAPSDPSNFGSIMLPQDGVYFIAKYDSDGTAVWATRDGGPLPDAFALAASDSGNSFVTGGFGQVFVAKHNTDGTSAWVRTTTGGSEASGRAIAASPDGGAVVTGYINGSVAFGSITLDPIGGRDIFLAKYDTNGAEEWARRMGSASGGEGGFGIAVSEDGSIFLTGEFRGTATFDSITIGAIGLTDVFVAKYSSAGALIWVTRAGSDLTGASQEIGHAISVLPDGGALVTGNFALDATFGEGEPMETILTSVGGSDVFLARYASNGTLTWAKRAGGAGHDSAFGVTYAPDKASAFVTGEFTSAGATFGLGELNETDLTSAGGLDLFVARYGVALDPLPTSVPTTSGWGRIILALLLLGIGSIAIKRH